jgi:hypothetical protein
MARVASFVALIITVSAALSAQESITGTWQGKTPSGMSILLDVVAKGDELTGTMTVGKQKSTIENGKLSKKAFTFSVTLGGGTEAFTGEIIAPEIKMWMDDRGPSTAITLTRVNPL